MGLQQRSEFFRVKNLEIWPKTRILSKDLLRFWSFFVWITHGDTPPVFDEMTCEIPHHPTMTSWHIPRPTGLTSAGTRRDVAAPIILILQVKPPPFGKPYERNEELMAMARKNGTYIWNRSELVKICQNVALTGRLTMFFLFWPCLRAGTLTGTQKWPSRRKLIFYDILPLHFWSQYSTWN